jgi:3-deoxy-D-manno-octulosonate 8-phosphate phosphatase KdsC-like HAD superfamily phosphatase
MYVGNDLNDYDAMLCFKYRICPSDSNLHIKKISNIHLNSIGGKNVLQEIFEDVLKFNPLNFL